MSKTERIQAEILEFIPEYTRTHGWPPSVREIMVATGLKSTSSTDYHLSALEADGFIVRIPGIARGIKILQEVES